MFTQDQGGIKCSHSELDRDKGQGRTLDTIVAIVFLGEQYSAPIVKVSNSQCRVNNLQFTLPLCRWLANPNNGQYTERLGNTV